MKAHPFQPLRAALAALFLGGAAATAGQLEICNVQPNIDYACNNCNPTARELPIAVFDFSREAKLASLSGIEFTMSMQVPNPANPGLHLALNGIDTGIALNGFDRDTLLTNTFSLDSTTANWLSPEKQAALLDSIRTHNGEITASILADTPAQLKLQLYSDTDVKLCLTGETPTTPNRVPEPGAYLLWSLAVGAVALRRRAAA